ncbi:MAG: nucleoside deaminase [Clostridia bacterium]|nr:nucleoside deaminase [Clostridia bacterium]
MSYEKWMRLALDEAQLSFDEDEVPVGAVVVRDGAVVASAHNQGRAMQDETWHAEFVAMRRARALLGSLEGCTLYVTLEPCAMCAGAMLLYRLPRLVFGAYDEHCGCCGSQIDLTDHWFYHSVETYGGVMEAECVKILQDFFQKKR